MKNLLLIGILCFPFLAQSQNGQIIAITTNPANPTTADFVQVYVELMFNSGGCDVDSKAHNTSGNVTTASAHHCVGMLTVICSVTDTFDLGYLQAGTHQFDFTLSSGSGGPPCSPGIVPDDSDTYSFTVSSGMGNEELSVDDAVKVYPNPVNEILTLEIAEQFVNTHSTIIITDASGREVFCMASINTDRLVLHELNFSSGLYFYQLLQEGKLISSGKLVKE